MNDIDLKKVIEWKLLKSTGKIFYCFYLFVNIFELSVKECGYKMECDIVFWGCFFGEFREIEIDLGVDFS